jgi:hypothetical protein
MTTKLTATAAVVLLCAAAVGCSSSSEPTIAAPTHNAVSKPAAAASPTPTPATTPDSSCDGIRTAISQPSENKQVLDTMNTSTDEVKFTSVTVDNACFMVIATNLGPDNALVKQLSQAGPQMWFSQKDSVADEGIKGMAITGAGPNHPLLWSSDPKQY